MHTCRCKQAASLAQVCPSETQATESQISVGAALSVQQSVGALHGVPAPEHLPTTEAQVCEVASQNPEQHVVPPWQGSLKTPHEITPASVLDPLPVAPSRRPAVGGSSAPAAWTAVASNARCASLFSARTASAKSIRQHCHQRSRLPPRPSHGRLPASCPSMHRRHCHLDRTQCRWRHHFHTPPPTPAAKQSPTPISFRQCIPILQSVRVRESAVGD